MLQKTPRSRTYPPPPVKPDYSDKIRNLEISGTALFKGANKITIQCLASRIGKDLSRKFMTRCQESGVRVWRVA